MDTIHRWIGIVMLTVAVVVAAAVWRLTKEIRRTWRRSPMATGLTWKCHVCQEERPDHMIAVFRVDVSDDFGLPPGQAFNNVRHCIDRPRCIKDAETIRWVPPRVEEVDG